MDAREAKTIGLLLEAARLLADLPDATTGLDRLGEIMLRALPHNRTVIYRFDAAESQLQVLSAEGQPTPPVGASFALDEMTPAARSVLETGRTQVVHVDSLPSNSRGITAEYGVRTLLAVPLRSRGCALGIIVVDDTDSPDRSFSQRDIEVVEAFGAQVAQVIDSASLLGAEARARTALTDELATTRLLLSVTTLVSADCSLDEVLDAIATVLLEATSHSRVSVVLLDARAGTLTMAVSKGDAPVPMDTVMPLALGSPALRQAMNEKRRIIADYDNMPGHDAKIIHEHASHLTLIAPILYHGRSARCGVVGRPWATP